MKADANDHGPERIMVIPPDLHFQEMIVIQDTIIYAFAGSTFTVDGAV